MSSRTNISCQPVTERRRCHVTLRVMVFDKGQLKESGKPADLLADSYSMFAEMARHAPGLKAITSTDSDDENHDSAFSGLGTVTEDSVHMNGFI